MSMTEEEQIAAMEAAAAAEAAQAAAATAGEGKDSGSEEEVPATAASPASAAVGSAARAEFEPLDDESSGGPAGDLNLDMILDVPVSLAMEVGRVRIPIRNLLQLNQGSVVELDRAAGEPLDVFVNGTLIAHGEVVVVNEKFGVRLIDVVSPSERVRNLR